MDWLHWLSPLVFHCYSDVKLSAPILDSNCSMNQLNTTTVRPFAVFCTGLVWKWHHNASHKLALRRACAKSCEACLDCTEWILWPLGTVQPSKRANFAKSLLQAKIARVCLIIIVNRIATRTVLLHAIHVLGTFLAFLTDYMRDTP